MAIQDELPKSRITLVYRTTITGQPETVSLPFRLLVLGDFSLGTSKDRKTDLDERATRGVDGKNLAELIADMGITTAFTVANKVNAADDGEELNVTLPITSMKSFHPDEIVKQIPKLRALQLLKSLLLETQGNVDNRKDLRKGIYELFSDPAALKGVLEQLKDYEGLRLPAPEAPKP